MTLSMYIPKEKQRYVCPRCQDIFYRLKLRNPLCAKCQKEASRKPEVTNMVVNPAEGNRRVLAFRWVLFNCLTDEQYAVFSKVRVNLSIAIQDKTACGPEQAMIAADETIAVLFFDGYLEHARRKDNGRFGSIEL